MHFLTESSAHFQTLNLFSLALLNLTRLLSSAASFITLQQRWCFCSWQNYTLKLQLISLLSSLLRTTEKAAVETSTKHFSSSWESLNLCKVQKLSEKALAAATVWWTQILISFAKYPSRNKHWGGVHLMFMEKSRSRAQANSYIFTSPNILMLL